MEKDLSFLITEEMVNQFAEFSGDKNLLHLDGDFAKRTIFRKKISHGTIILSKISHLLTKRFGDGTILLTEQIKFLKPAYIGDMITLSIIKVKKDKRGVNETEITVLNQNKEKILEVYTTSKTVYIKKDKNE